MDDVGMLSETEKLLLVAAVVQGLGPETDLGRANTSRIVDLALYWLGMSPEEICRGWWELEADEGGPPGHEAALNDTVYNVLVRMTQPSYRAAPARAPERTGPPLFEGNGNWGVPGDPGCPPCMPHFNSCRLTERGERIARELLEQCPELRRKAEQFASANRPRK